MNKDQIITPWDLDGTMDDFFVPEYIVEMAQEVIQQYDLTVGRMEVITTKADKGGLIWKIETDQGPKSLKILHRRPTRSLFSIGAQEYLVEVKKARVPPIVKTKTGENTVEKGGKLWFIADWIEPLQQVAADLEGAKLLSHAIGEFHQLSKGYVPPKGAENASRLYRWPKTYNKMIKKINWFKDVANAYPEMPASAAVLSTADMFEEQARKAATMLEQSNYEQLVSRGNKEWGLVHQDYGWSNGQMGPGGMWIIDLDGVAYDLPIRDLRKLITSAMDDLGGWDLSWIIGMLEAYHEANPIEDDVFNILVIDLCLPNLYYKNVKEMLYEPTISLDAEMEAVIQRIAAIDKTKWPIIEQLKTEWKGGKQNESVDN
ncbi:spore coat protein, CotS family [Evansella caseinilytica]|uniref:Spore coat protein, CotS family n=1 Tax=Evansella caseinilytica TaxID=1503961 RepID=A0A1H3GXT0_9BACI|nr:CotS family spore coat protein [Evansella caseinilytica]SDY08123.1 spore coat protein, CotS family [Evansella caseinilytica]